MERQEDSALTDGANAGIGGESGLLLLSLSLLLFTMG